MHAIKLFVFVLLVSVPFKGKSQSIEKMPDGNWWTTSNLNLDISDSYCYGDSVTHCERYGRLYTWEAARIGCSSLGEGWHLPSTAEWKELSAHFGGEYEENVNDGTVSFKTLSRTEKPAFAATLGGNRNVDGTYDRIERHGFYWTSTAFDNDNAGFLNFANGRKVLFLQLDMEKGRAISVRCIKAGE